MCGICGFLNHSDNWEKNIRKMCDAMISRGPDASGEWSTQDHTVVLGHRRLSIMDLSESGAQPMVSSNGRYVIVINGEIYNHKKIAAKLLKDGKVRGFRGTSDTEILVEAIEAYGVSNALEMSTGMFAIAVYDLLQRKLYLVRDRMGEKPLYYGFAGKSFVFASEPKVIRAFDVFHPVVNKKALTLFFKRGYIPYTHCIYEGIFKLEPGMILELEYPYNEYRKYRYWNLKDIAIKGKDNPFKGTEEEAAEELSRLLKSAISDQMIADVPVGAFLSGGIDSSAIVSLMQELAGKNVKSFTVRNKNHDTDESVIARQIAKYIGTDNITVDATPEDVIPVIPLLYKHYSEPFADTSMIPSYMVCQLAKKNVTVALSGDAGDELFCGYGWYWKRDKIWRNAKRVPLIFRQALSGMIKHTSLNKIELFSHGAYFFDSVSTIDYISRTGGTARFLDQLIIDSGNSVCQYDDQMLEGMETIFSDTRELYMYMDQLSWLAEDILAKVDRASMAVSLETRIPLLDKHIVEFSWSIPIEYKMSKGIQKKILKDVLFSKVPREFFECPKQGFGIPLFEWLRIGKLRNWAEEILDFEKIKKEGILNSEIVKYYWKCFQKNGSYGRYIWSLIMFEQWYNHYILNYESEK